MTSRGFLFNFCLGIVLLKLHLLAVCVVPGQANYILNTGFSYGEGG